MRKLRIFFAAILFLSVTTLSAQRTSFNQSFGLGGSWSNLSGVTAKQVDTTTITAKYGVKLLQFGIVYYPRIDLLSWESGSFSIGSPLMLGFSVTGNYASSDFYHRVSAPDSVAATTGVSGGSIAFTIPLVADLNIGLHSAAEEDRSSLGMYVGAGYAYNFTRIKTSIGFAAADGYETLFRTGIRLGRSWENRFTIGFNVRGAFMDNNHPKTYEIHLLKDL